MKKVLSADLLDRLDEMNHDALSLQALSERLQMLQNRYEGREGDLNMDLYWTAMEEVNGNLDSWAGAVWINLRNLTDFLREDIPLESVSEAG